jgi:non-ribosomal peptide synthetase component F
MHTPFRSLAIITLMGVTLLSAPIFAQNGTTVSSASQPSNDQTEKDQADADSSEPAVPIVEQLSAEAPNKSSIENMLQLLTQLKGELQTTITHLNKEMESLATQNAGTLTPNQSEMIETDLFKQEAKLQRMLRDIDTQIDYLKALLEPKD